MPANHPVPTSRNEVLDRIRRSPRLSAVMAELPAEEHGVDGAHNHAHLFRVALWACRILADPALVEEAIAAALLHDLVNVPKNHPDRSKASERSAEAAAPLLRDSGFDAAAVSRICLAIRQHSFSRGEKPDTPLAQALQDADRLEALGAIGIMRVFSTGERMGAAYFHPDDPWAEKRPLDDSRFSVDHFFVKLLRLPETMNTPLGREEAGTRARQMLEFLNCLGRELGAERAKERVQ